jgi:AhpD family alkylhydroperoxidase
MNKMPDNHFQKTVPKLFTSFIDIHKLIDEYGIDRKLSHIVLLRASQINHCEYCIAMHTREAKLDGETNQRLEKVESFRQHDCFLDREKLALEWAEALTTLNTDTNYTDLRSRLAEQFNITQISALTALVGMINIWNRIRISEH